ncbi:MAG: hypothetical protein D6683_13380 [Actinomyces sp.]|nr:MAG: hypothetical protein D6683_13380 [Actinomyces sp.]
MEALYQLSYSPAVRGRMLAGADPGADTSVGVPFLPRVDGAGAVAAALIGRRAVRVRRVGTGHVHTTWRVVDADGRVWCVQRLGTHVFRRPEALVRNDQVVAAALERAGRPDTRAVWGRDGATWWRVRRWLAGRRPRSRCDAEVVAAARAVGTFVSAVAGVGGRLATALEGFHDPTAAVDRLEGARRECAPTGRTHAVVAQVVAAAHELLERAEDLGWADLAPRVVHGDARLANVVLTPQGRGHLVDLDTVMTGTLAHDVGELVRSVADARRRGGRPVTAGAVATWIGAVCGALEPDARPGPAETACLALAGALLAAENAVRRATAHLVGDHRFGPGPPGADLTRAVEMADLARELAVLAPDVARHLAS